MYHLTQYKNITYLFYIHKYIILHNIPYIIRVKLMRKNSIICHMCNNLTIISYDKRNPMYICICTFINPYPTYTHLKLSCILSNI